MPSKSFTQKIYELAKKIPKGKVTTYKILAEAAGTKAYRAVGQAMRQNPHSPIVPCHRVVNSNESIGGFSGKINPNSNEVKRKIRMLRKEGIKIKNNKINLEKYLFKFQVWYNVCQSFPSFWHNSKSLLVKSIHQ